MNSVLQDCRVLLLIKVNTSSTFESSLLVSRVVYALRFLIWPQEMSVFSGGLTSKTAKREQEMTIISSTTSPGGLFPCILSPHDQRRQLFGVFDSWHFVNCLLTLFLINTSGHINQWLCTLPSLGAASLLSYHSFSASSLRSVFPFCFPDFKFLPTCNHHCQVQNVILPHAVYCTQLTATTRAGTHTTHTHTEGEIEMRHRCQLGEMAAITLITLLSETQSLSTPSVSLSSLGDFLSSWKRIRCVSVLLPLFLREKKSDV